MPRKLVALAAAAVCVLALAAGANAATYSFSSLDEVEIPTPNGFISAGSLVNTAPQFGLPAGATVGRYTAQLVFLSPSSGSATGVFVIPNGRIIAGGTFNPNTGQSQSLPARSLGTLRASGTLSLLEDSTGAGVFVFELN